MLLLGVVMAGAATARAEIGSTVDEWAARFLPEAGPPLDLPSYADAYDTAAAQVNLGRYRAALCTIAGIEKPDPARTLPLRSESLAGLGETKAAIDLLQHSPIAQDPAALALQAKWALAAGDLPTARSAIDTLAKVAPQSLVAHLLQGQLAEQTGDFPAAIDAYAWFVVAPQTYLEKWQNDPEQFESAADLVTLATGIQRWAYLTEAFKTNQSLNDTILAMYTRAYDVVDRESIAARVAAAEFALSHSDGETAQNILSPLMRQAPTNRDVLQAETRLAMLSGDERLMRGVIDAYESVDPDSADAELLNLMLLTRARSSGALSRAETLAQRYPHRLDVLGADAGIAYIAGQEKACDTRLAQADAQWPRRSDAYVQAAEFLEMAFQRDKAESLLKTAISRTPWETKPRHLLGDLYLNDGYNAQALAALEEAKALDPYNVKTINYLRLLDDLSKYDQLATQHFVIYSDKDADPIAAPAIGAYMESTYADICQVFNYWPNTKLIIQIYPHDDEFSVRMAGVPGVENFGVSFGRVLATIAPRAGTAQGNFNFARVLRHEFVHTINLLQTQERCPRWLTEGLAVWQEHVPFRFANVPPELYKRTMADELFSIRAFPMAFLRPKKPTDGEQAYTQGAYLAKYLEATYGQASIVRLLNAYGQSMSSEDAFHAATGKPMEQVERDWHAWMKTKLKPWGYDKATTERVKTIETQADAALKAKDLPEALKLWQSACDLQPAEVAPHQRLAYLYMQPALANPAKAIEHLTFLHNLEFQDSRYAKQIARLYAKMNDVPHTIEWAQQATYVKLYDPAAHQMLADAYAKAGAADKAAAERQVVAEIELWQQKQALNKPPADQ
ncbi:MAG: peptidase MA family metallohydrolase [Tepidisphaeraceae bacterium]